MARPCEKVSRRKKWGIIYLTMQRSSAWRGDAPCRLPDCFDCVSCTARRGMPLRRMRSRSIPDSLPIRPRASSAASGWASAAAFGCRPSRNARARRPRSCGRAAAALLRPPREQAFGNARRVGVHGRQGRFPAHGGSFPQSAISSRQAGLFPAIRAARSAMMAAVSRGRMLWRAANSRT